jgi:hypothetical protein
VEAAAAADAARGREEAIMLSSRLANCEIDERERCPVMLSSAFGAIRTVPRIALAWLVRRLGAYTRCSGSRNGLGSGDAVDPPLNTLLSEGRRVPPCPPPGEPRPGSGVSTSGDSDTRPGGPWPDRRIGSDLLLCSEFSFTSTRGSVDFERDLLAGWYLPGTMILPSAELGRLDGFSNCVPLSESPPAGSPLSPAILLAAGACVPASASRCRLSDPGPLNCFLLSFVFSRVRRFSFPKAAKGHQGAFLDGDANSHPHCQGTSIEERKELNDFAFLCPPLVLCLCRGTGQTCSAGTGQCNLPEREARGTGRAPAGEKDSLATGCAPQEERQSLLESARPDGDRTRGSYGAVEGDSPRICLCFHDAYLGGKRSAWLSKLRSAGFVVEQTSANLVAVAAPDEMLYSVAARRGSHGQHTMPATRERSLHLLLSEVDPTFAAFLEVPGPFSNSSKRAQLSPELEELGLVGWFWLHNKEAAANIAPRYAWSGCFGLAREPLKHAREYFGTEIAWDLLFLNFVSRWMLVPAVGGAAYTYVMALSFVSTGSVDNPFMPFFSGATMAWGFIMLGFWVRLKSRYEEKWREDVAISGLEDVNTDAEMEVVVDDETGEVKLVYPQWKHQAKLVASAIFLLPCVALILGAGLGALDLRARIINLDPQLVDGISIGGVLGGLVTAILVFVAVRGVAMHWCGVLTHWENHTRRSSYQYAFNAKCFWLEVLGHVFPMVYLALLDLPILSRFAPAAPASGSLLDALTVQATTVFLAWWLASALSMWWETSGWQQQAARHGKVCCRVCGCGSVRWCMCAHVCVCECLCVLVTTTPLHTTPPYTLRVLLRPEY